MGQGLNFAYRFVFFSFFIGTVLSFSAWSSESESSLAGSERWSPVRKSVEIENDGIIAQLETEANRNPVGGYQKQGFSERWERRKKEKEIKKFHDKFEEAFSNIGEAGDLFNLIESLCSDYAIKSHKSKLVKIKLKRLKESQSGSILIIARTEKSMGDLGERDQRYEEYVKHTTNSSAETFSQSIKEEQEVKSELKDEKLHKEIYELSGDIGLGGIASEGVKFDIEGKVKSEKEEKSSRRNEERKYHGHLEKETLLPHSSLKKEQRVGNSIIEELYAIYFDIVGKIPVVMEGDNHFDFNIIEIFKDYASDNPDQVQIINLGNVVCGVKWFSGKYTKKEKPRKFKNEYISIDKLLDE